MKIFTALMAAWGFFCFTFVIMSTVGGRLSVTMKWYHVMCVGLFVVLSFLVFYKG